MKVRTAAGISWDELLGQAAGRLGDAREARWMVEEVGGARWPELTGPSGHRPTERLRSRLEEMVDRRRKGEPLQYVLGSWSFRGLELLVDPRVLIPRPETEQLVDRALAELDRLVDSKPGDAGRRDLTVVDLGTGSGAIALSIAAERPGTHVWATDTSAAALEVAGANLAGLGGRPAARVCLKAGDWFGALPVDLRGKIDLVVSNPPYVSEVEFAVLPPEVRDWEPSEALLGGGPGGTEAIEVILEEAIRWLRPDGVLLVELAPHQAVAMTHLARSIGYPHVAVLDDLAGRPRVLVGRCDP